VPLALTPGAPPNAKADWIATATARLSADTNVAASDSSPLRVGMHVWEEKIGVNYRF
jgi:hypothetical protein